MWTAPRYFFNWSSSSILYLCRSFWHHQGVSFPWINFLVTVFRRIDLLGVFFLYVRPFGHWPASRVAWSRWLHHAHGSRERTERETGLSRPLSYFLRHQVAGRREPRSVAQGWPSTREQDRVEWMSVFPPGQLHVSPGVLSNIPARWLASFCLNTPRGWHCIIFKSELCVCTEVLSGAGSCSVCFSSLHPTPGCSAGSQTPCSHLRSTNTPTFLGNPNFPAGFSADTTS